VEAGTANVGFSRSGCTILNVDAEALSVLPNHAVPDPLWK